MHHRLHPYAMMAIVAGIGVLFWACLLWLVDAAARAWLR